MRKSGDCTWNNTSKTLSFTGITECVLTVTAEKTGYVSKSKDFSITPLGVFTSITWPAFPLTAQQDTPIASMADPVSVPAADSYAIAKNPAIVLGIIHPRLFLLPE